MDDWTPVEKPPLGEIKTLPAADWVGQVDRSGCVIACIAMIVERTYAEIRECYLTHYGRDDNFARDFNLNAVGNGAGVVTHEAVHILSIYGYEVNALNPDRIVAYLGSVAMEYGCRHQIVVYPDGQARDPADLAVRHVSDLPELIGLIPFVNRRADH